MTVWSVLSGSLYVQVVLEEGREEADGGEAVEVDGAEGAGKKRWWQCCKQCRGKKDKKPPKLGWIMGVLVSRREH